MKAFVLSDIHPDTWFQYANKPSALRGDDVKEDVVISTMEYLWKTFDYPDTDAIVLAGDVANDWLTYTRAVKWLSNKYKEVYMCLGNHDILVRGGTPSRSNLQFKTSEEKIASIQDFCNTLGNVHLLEGRIFDNMAGCMGMYSVAPVGDMAVDGVFWQLLAYCAGVGGSMLIVGSAAGVVVMGLEKITFGWYMKRISWIAFVGYIAGILCYWLESAFIFA